MSKELELIRTLIDGANEYEKKTGNTNPTVYLSRNNLLVIEQALLKAQKEHKALEILKRNVKVSIDYGKEGKDISMALVFYIDNKKTIYVVDEAIKEQNPEHFKELELLKEVVE